jgi:hypothetical protein
VRETVTTASSAFAADPLIPGTDVPRMELVPLGERAQGATDIEIKRVMEGLCRCAQRKRAQVTL